MFIATLRKELPRPQERNVYSYIAVKISLAPEERNVYGDVCQKELPRSTAAKCL